MLWFKKQQNLWPGSKTGRSVIFLIVLLLYCLIFLIVLLSSPPLPVQPRWKKRLQEVTEIKIMYWFIHISQTYVHDIHWASDKMEAAGCATDVVQFCCWHFWSDWLTVLFLSTGRDRHRDGWRLQCSAPWHLRGSCKKWNAVNWVGCK